MLSNLPYASLVVGLHLVSESERTSAPKSHGPLVYTVMEEGNKRGYDKPDRVLPLTTDSHGVFVWAMGHLR